MAKIDESEGEVLRREEMKKTKGGKNTAAAPSLASMEAEAQGGPSIASELASEAQQSQLARFDIQESIDPTIKTITKKP
jgi:hypothetical protein